MVSAITVFVGVPTKTRRNQLYTSRSSQERCLPARRSTKLSRPGPLRFRTRVKRQKTYRPVSFSLLHSHLSEKEKDRPPTAPPPHLPRAVRRQPGALRQAVAGSAACCRQIWSGGLGCGGPCARGHAPPAASHLGIWRATPETDNLTVPLRHAILHSVNLIHRSALKCHTSAAKLVSRTASSPRWRRGQPSVLAGAPIRFTV